MNDGLFYLLLTLWIGGTVVTWLTAGIMAADRSDSAEERRFAARVFFLAPLWPLMLSWLIAIMLYRVFRLAITGEDEEKR